MCKKLSRQFIRQIMIGTMLYMLFLSVPLLVHAENKSQVEEADLIGTITTDSTLNVRSGPGKEHEVIDKVKNDTLLHITGQTQDGWYQIELDGQTGYVSAQYVSADTPDFEEAENEEEGKVIGEPEEGYRGLNQSPQVKKIILIGTMIVIVLIMTVITLIKMRREDEDYDDEYEDEEDDEDEDDDDEDDEEVRVTQKKNSSKKREYVIREEDYRIWVDPSFFEDKEYIEQPDMVTGYLEKLALEEEKERKKGGKLSEEKQKELEKAMEKLIELQKEIERMKNGE